MLTINAVKQVLKVHHEPARVTEGGIERQGYTLWRDDRDDSIILSATGYSGAAYAAIMMSYRMDLNKAGLRIDNRHNVYVVSGDLDPDWRSKVKSA